jgi:GNAT superfamily N-acetyltransferase
VIQLRPGTPDDLDALLGLFDEAVEWLVARGQPEQWGSEAWSGSERHRAFVTEMASHPGLVIAEEDGAVVGASIVGEPMPYAPAPTSPELYLRLLITSRRHRGRDIGRLLLDQVFQRAREAGVPVVRVDCYNAPGLVGWYESQGFVSTQTVPVGPVEVRILEQRV